MNRNFIFVFILLATFSMINALSFDSCPAEDSDLDLLIVSIKPDPPVSEQPEDFTVSGTLEKDITAGKTVLGISYSDLSGKNLLGVPIKQNFDKSFKAGDPFNITASSVETPELPDAGYTITVVVGDPSDDPKGPFDTFGCAFAKRVGKTP